MQKRHTSQDIADLLGISRGTVYRALNNAGRISEETKRRVLETAERIGYKPNKLARTLVLQKDIRIVAILPSIPEYFFGKIEQGIRDAEKELKDFGVSVTYYHTKAVNDVCGQIELFEKAIQEKYDGMLIIPANPVLLRPHVDAAVEAGMPVVALNNDLPDSKRLCFVGEDSMMAGRVAAELMGKFLAKKGQVAILSGFPQASGLRERAKGFISVMRESFPQIELIGTYEYFEDKEEAYQITKRLTIDYPQLAGVFLTTTTGLEASARAILDCGKQDVIKAIGFDVNDEIEELMQKNVIYAAIHQDPHAQGYYSLKILSRYLTDGKMPEKEHLYTRLGILLSERPSVDGYPLYKY